MENGFKSCSLIVHSPRLMASRGRWKGSCKQLGDALGEGVTEPTDLQYDGNPQKAVFNKKLLFATPMRKLIQNLHALDARMNFKKRMYKVRFFAFMPTTASGRKQRKHDKTTNITFH